MSSKPDHDAHHTNFLSKIRQFFNLLAFVYVIVELQIAPCGKLIDTTKIYY